MSERYVRLYQCAAPQVQGDAPVMLAAGVLLGDKETGRVLAQVKLQNISEKTIKAVYVRVRCMDAMNVLMPQQAEAKYMDLTAKPGNFFGDRQPILLEDASTRSFTLQVTDVMFADNTSWHNTGSDAFTPIPEIPCALTKELLEQLSLETNVSCKTSPVALQYVKRCACGQWNLGSNAACAGCKMDLEKLASVATSQYLTTRYETRKKREAEEAEVARIRAERLAEEKRKEQERREAERKRFEEERAKEEEIRRAKQKKFAIIGGSTVAVVVAIVLLITQVIVPSNTYRKAEKLRANGQWAEAVAVFEGLGSYSDAEDQVFATYYAEGEAKRSAEDWNGAREAFESARGCITKRIMAKGLEAATEEDANRYITANEQIYATYYAEGEAKRMAEEWNGAREAFTSAKDYSDASEQIKATYYAEGVAKREACDWDGAVDAFMNAGDYSDAAEQIKATYYAEGVAKRAAGDDDGADAAFKNAGDYSDANDKLYGYYYDIGVAEREAGDWDGAAEAFNKAGNYSDAAEQIKATYYAEGVAKREASDWPGAIVAFNKADGYSDAAEQIKATYYAEGVAKRAAGDDDGADAAFKNAGDYSDANDKLYGYYYDMGVTKREAGDWDGAVKAFNKAGNYSDAAEQVFATYYAEGVAKREAEDWAGARAAFKKGDNGNRVLDLATGKYNGNKNTSYDATEEIKATYYAEGIAKQKAGNWSGAVAAFKNAGDYSDAEAKAEAAQMEIDYQAAEALYSAGDYEDAKEIYEKLTGYKDVDSKLTACDNEIAAALEAKFTVGNYVEFGTYPQTASGTDSTPIEWLVLARDGNKALLTSRYGLDAQHYNKEYKSVTWETCTLRTWLNSTFMNKAFTTEEQKAILTTTVDNSSSQGYSGWSTNGGNNTQDQIFLLSYAEENKYFGVEYWSNSGADKNTKARVKPTAYAEKQGAYTNSDYKTEDGSSAGWWWLRSPGSHQSRAALVYTDGSLRSGSASSDTVCIRPAMWVNLDALPD